MQITTDIVHSKELSIGDSYLLQEKATSSPVCVMVIDITAQGWITLCPLRSLGRKHWETYTSKGFNMNFTILGKIDWSNLNVDNP